MNQRGSGNRILILAGILVAFIALYLVQVLPHEGRTQTGIGPASPNFLEAGRPLYSEKMEEVIIRDFFKDRRNGIFVDIGCSHYKIASTTYYLEKNLGWSGIGVDAIMAFLIDYKKFRPRTKFLSYIVTDVSGLVQDFYISIYGSEVSSTDERYVIRAIETGHFKMSSDVKDIKDAYQKISVPTITMNDLLAQNGVTKIDFLSMDIEGGEVNALKGFDIGKYKPELVCIETHTHRAELLEYFKNNGYELIEKYIKYDQQNYYFKPKSAQTLSAT